MQQQQQWWHRPMTSNPRLDPDSAHSRLPECPLQLWSCQTHSTDLPQPWLGVGCGDRSRGAPLAPTNSLQPLGEPAQAGICPTPRDVHQHPQQPSSAALLVLGTLLSPKGPMGSTTRDGTCPPHPSPTLLAGQGAKPKFPEHKTALWAPARPGSLLPTRSWWPQGTAAPGTLRLWTPLHPGVPAGSWSILWHRRYLGPHQHSCPWELSPLVPPCRSAWPPPRGCPLAGLPHQPLPRHSCPGAGMSLPHTLAWPRGLVWAANTS